MRHRKLLMILLILTALLALLPAASVAQPEPLHIVASFSILADVVQNVVGDAAVVTTLIPVGGDPHAFTPSARDLAALAEADLVFISGAGFEAQLMEAIENAGVEMRIVTASACIPILPVGAAHNHDDDDAIADAIAEATAEAPALTDDLAPIAERCAAHDAELHALYEAEATAAHAEVESLGVLYTLACGAHDHHTSADEPEDICDPHVWQDARSGIYWALQIRDTLTTLDPANAEHYAANAAAYTAALASLAQEVIHPLIATLPQERRVLVTSHDTFAYFAAAYDFQIVGVVLPGGSTLAEPSAGDIAALIDLINTGDIPALFAETTINPDLVAQIAAETGAGVYVLYSDSLSPADGPAPTYLDLLRYNAQTIVGALGGG